MILTQTKNWQVEQGSTGNYLIIYDFKNETCHIVSHHVSHHAQYRTIECSDDLSHIPDSLKELVSKWCTNKAAELRAENKVVLRERMNPNE